jgi:hypothetical protein
MTHNLARRASKTGLGGPQVRSQRLPRRSRDAKSSGS